MEKSLQIWMWMMDNAKEHMNSIGEVIATELAEDYASTHNDRTANDEEFDIASEVKEFFLNKA